MLSTYLAEQPVAWRDNGRRICDDDGAVQSTNEKRRGRVIVPIIALLGFCIQANAQPLCPELTRLHREAQEALKQSKIIAASERCYIYNRLSVAWGTVAQYANDHREQCRVSTASMNEFERHHRETVQARDNICAGRPLRPYPPDIIQR